MKGKTGRPSKKLSPHNERLRRSKVQKPKQTENKKPIISANTLRLAAMLIDIVLMIYKALGGPPVG